MSPISFVAGSFLGAGVLYAVLLWAKWPRQRWLKYLVKFQKATGDGEICEVSFNEASDDELRRRVALIGEVTQARLTASNEAVLAHNMKVERERAQLAAEAAARSAQPADPVADLKVVKR